MAVASVGSGGRRRHCTCQHVFAAKKTVARIALLPAASYQLSQTAMEQEQQDSDRASANYRRSDNLNVVLDS